MIPVKVRSHSREAEGLQPIIDVAYIDPYAIKSVETETVERPEDHWRVANGEGRFYSRQIMLFHDGTRLTVLDDARIIAERITDAKRRSRNGW